MWWAVGGCAIVAVIGIGVLVNGAPFVPTRKKWIDDAMKLAGVGPGDVVVDLGSGDGAFLSAALEHGARRVVGYEINPWLVVWSRLKLRRELGKLVSREAREDGERGSDEPRNDVREERSRETSLPSFAIKTGDFFRAELPADVTVIYLFQVEKVLRKIPDFIERQRGNLKTKKLRVVCFGAEIPGRKFLRERGGMSLYEF
jgi:hypothetical protein